jgi:hypothetical protein
VNSKSIIQCGPVQHNSSEVSWLVWVRIYAFIKASLNIKEGRNELEELCIGGASRVQEYKLERPLSHHDPTLFIALPVTQSKLSIVGVEICETAS